jgi:HAD superfamily hydrolase (TIGR01509 family)
MPELKALIFDVDGTLADTEEAHRIAFNKAFDEADLDWHWDVDDYHALLAVTGGKERMLHYIRQYRPDFRHNTTVANDLTSYIAALHERKTEIYTDMLAGGEVPLRQGVERLLNAARDQGIRLAVATTTSLVNVEALFAHTLGSDALEWFDVIAAGDCVKAKKPASDIYDYALSDLGLKAAECIAFEDSENGLRAASSAGLGVIITVNAYTSDHDFNSALLVLDHMGEPAIPFEVLAGEVNGHSYLDLELIRHLHARHLVNTA